MERKIGEIFEYNGEWYQCIVGNGCKNCAFYEIKCYNDNNDPIGDCCALIRKDNKEVIFKKLEKVGEPYEHYGKLYQCYKLLVEIEIRLLPDNCYPVGKDNLVEIEIKETKEDMEENKLNLKPFDIQKAREGKPVCTRDGRKARIICFDRDWDMSIVALVSDPLGESVHYYLSNGKIDFYKQNDEDLMMLPEKKEGWVNVYKGIDGITFSKHPYTSKDEAIKKSGILFGRIDTIKVSWEE